MNTSRRHGNSAKRNSKSQGKTASSTNPNPKPIAASTQRGRRKPTGSTKTNPESKTDNDFRGKTLAQVRYLSHVHHLWLVSLAYLERWRENSALTCILFYLTEYSQVFHVVVALYAGWCANEFNSYVVCLENSRTLRPNTKVYFFFDISKNLLSQFVCFPP